MLPTITLALGSAGYYSRILHTNLADAMEQDYIRTARGKGLSAAQAMVRHAMANAMLPLVTLAGLDLAGLLSGVVLTETVFNWPGIGRLAYEAVFNLDIPLIMGTVLFSAFLVVVANLGGGPALRVARSANPAEVRRHDAAAQCDGTGRRRDGAEPGADRDVRAPACALRSDPRGRDDIRRSRRALGRISTRHR